MLRALVWRISAITLLVLVSGSASAGTATRNIILVTLDGVRVQEFFSGMDAAVAAHEATAETYDIADLRQRYWRETSDERRSALMPYFWGTLVAQGMVFGNRDRGSSVTVRNNQWFSYPGYSEILTGAPQPEVTSNDLVRYPHETVLDFLHRRLDLPYPKTAQIGSWDGFKMAASRADGTFFMTGAYDDVPASLATPEMQMLTGLRRDVMELWEEGSNDALTFRLGLAYLKKHQPRVLWLGFSQSDDWAHARRYDRLLDYFHLMDGFLKELWDTVAVAPRVPGPHHADHHHGSWARPHACRLARARCRNPGEPGHLDCRHRPRHSAQGRDDGPATAHPERHRGHDAGAAGGGTQGVQPRCRSADSGNRGYAVGAARAVHRAIAPEKKNPRPIAGPGVFS